MSTVLRAVQRSWQSSFRRCGAAAAMGVAAVALGWEHDTSSCESRIKSRLTRTPSEGVERRDLVRCRGGPNELEANYELEEKIGTGSFGSVRKAVHRMTGLSRAIKKVEVGHDEETDEAVEWERMLSEVQALMELDHPNIVRLYEYYRSADTLYLVEEYCSGGTLEHRLEAAGGRLAPDEAALAMRQMLRGLLCCHAHGLAHRDLKPDNFVYGSEHESASIKLIDFGLSMALPSKKVLSAGSTTGAGGSATGAKDGTGATGGAPLAYVEAAGTLEYTAPETLPKRDPTTGKMMRYVRYDQAADMWSLGAILFLMLTGEPLADFGRLRTSSAEFRRMMQSLRVGYNRDLLDDAAVRATHTTRLSDFWTTATEPEPDLDTFALGQSALTCSDLPAACPLAAWRADQASE